MEKREKRILLSTPTTHGDEMAYIQEAFDRNWVVPLGFNCDAFEKEISTRLSEGRKSCLCCSSGTSALHLAVKLSGISRGDVVLCSDVTFAASVNPIIYEGGIPVFVDSERETWNMDPRALEAAFEKYPQAKAVMLVHLYGTPAKMDEILEICKRHDAVLIEDAAEAISSSYKGAQCGTFGHLGALSFNGNKLITTSGGGMLICGSAEEREKALFLATQAREKAPWYQHEEIGYNYRMSNVLAGIGRGQLKHIEEHRSKKQAIHHRYVAGLRGLPVTMNPYLKESRPNFWLSCLLIEKDCPVTFMEILNKLESMNVESRPMWKPMHMQPVFSSNDLVYVEESPVGEDIFSRGLCLPSDIKMSEADQQYVMDVICSCF